MCVDRGGTPGPRMFFIVACMSQCLNMCKMIPDSNWRFVPRNCDASTSSDLIAPQGVLFTCQYSSCSLSSHCDQNPWSVWYDDSHAWRHSQVPQHLSMHTARSGVAIRAVTRLWAGRSGVQSPEEERHFSLLQSQLALRNTQPPLQRVPGSFPRVIRPEPKVDHSTPSSTEEWVKLYLYSPHTTSRRVQGSLHLLYFFFRILRYLSNRYVPYLQPTDGFLSLY